MDTSSFTENTNVSIDIHENTSQEQPIVVNDDEGAGARNNDDDVVWNEDHGDGRTG